MISALELLPQLDSKIEYTEITAHWVSHVLFIYLFIYMPFVIIGIYFISPKIWKITEQFFFPQLFRRKKLSFLI
jgi:hypothetical protein